jgi:undecaprenyl diphosphate synthase
LSGYFFMSQHDKPRHVAIIPDGNGRWAESRGLSRIQGYQRGVERLKKLIDHLVSHAISEATVFAFSCENQGRPAFEVRYIEQLIARTLHEYATQLHARQIKLLFFGDLSRLNKHNQKIIQAAMDKTAQNNGLRLNIGLHYSGRWHVAKMVQDMARSVEQGTLQVDAIDQDYIADWMCKGSWSEPDLLIRTGHEQRMSNFMLWHLAYTELHFPACFWPDFAEEQFDEALQVYAKRQRRYGLHFSQIKERA